MDLNLVPTKIIVLCREFTAAAAAAGLRVIDDVIVTWTQVGATNVWWAAYHAGHTGELEPDRLFVGTGGCDDHEWKRMKRLADLTAERSWWWDPDTRRIYVYATADPDSLDDVTVWPMIKLMYFNAKNRQGNTYNAYVSFHHTTPADATGVILEADRELGLTPFKRPDLIYWMAATAEAGEYMEFVLIGI